MTNIIKLKNSGTSSSTPTSLEYGELALNYADGKLYYKNSSNNIVEFTSSASLAGTVYNATIGDGTNTSYTITHNFGSRDVSVTIREAASPYGLILTSWEATSSNAITIYFDSAPSSNSIRVSVYIAVSGLEVGPTGSTGPEGPTGPTGPEGSPGEPGMDGMDGLGYVIGTQLGSSFDSESGLWTFDTENAGAFATGDYVRVVEDSENYISGFITQVSSYPLGTLIYVNPISTLGEPGFFPSFSIHLEGLPGSNGDIGETGPGFEFLGEYDSEYPYSIGDVVKITPAAGPTYYPSVTYISLVNSNQDYYPETSPSEWAVLVTDGPEGPTGPTGPPGTLGSATLDNLSNVTVPSPTNGDYLLFNGTAWVNDSSVVTLSGSQTLSNKTITTPTLTLSSSTSTSNGRIAWIQSSDKIVVGDGSIAVEFAPSTTLFNAQTASYTLALSDKDLFVEMNVGSANNLTVPPESSINFPIGSQINILQTGAGQTTIVAGSGVTVNATPGLKLRARWSSVTLIKRASNTWVALGDLQA
jgi:hypothetical protein